MRFNFNFQTDRSEIKLKSKSCKMISAISLLTVFSLVFCIPAFADKAVKVLILPFNIHSEKDMSFLREGIADMLSTRLTIEGESVPFSKDAAREAVKDLSEVSVTEQTAVSLGEKLKADYVLYGSLTVFGDSISTDARFYDLREKKAAVTFHETGKNNSDVISHIDFFAAEIKEKVFGYKSDPALTRRQPSRKTPADESRKHPDALWNETRHPGKTQAGDSEDFSAPPQAVSEAVPAQPSVKSGAVWKSKTFNIEIRGLAIGDTDGDGTNETVFVNEKDVSVYRYIQERFVKIAEIEGSAFYNILSLDVADINQNGKAEIFVTAMNSSSRGLLSFVLEWDGTQFQRIVDNSRWHYRVLNIAGQGTVLLGQKSGVRDVFSPGVYELKWERGDYVSAAAQQLPRDVNVYAFTYGDVMNTGQERLVAFNRSDYIRIMDREGNEDWKSNETFGGSTVYIEYPSEGAASIGSVKEMDNFYLPPRIILGDPDKDGKNEVFVIKNTDMTRRLLSRFRMFKSGIIECLAWDNLGLHEKWKTSEVSGYISDFAIADMNNDGKDELVFSAVTKIASVLGKAKSFIAFQNLPGKSE